MNRSIIAAVGGLILAATAAWSQPFPTVIPGPAASNITPAPFEEAVLTAVRTLFTKAVLPPGDAKIDLVIDPLIDGASGAESNATHRLEQRIIELVKRDYPRFQIQPFTKEVLAKSPIVLLGTFTAINNAGVATGPKDVYWICLVLADLNSKKIISKGGSRAKPDGVDVTPAAAYVDKPLWAPDAATAAYIKTCQASKPGDPVDAAYIAQIVAAALIREGNAEYDAKRYRESLAFYRVAMYGPGGNQLRALSGIYQANWKLNRRDDAAGAFGGLVTFGLKANKLAVRLVFKPGSTRFPEEPAISGPYSMWLKQISDRVDKSDACLEIVGHTSPTGPAQLNERLSVLRAEVIKKYLESHEPRLAERVVATGVGARENLIGTSKDDASDALDRRVEFKVLKC
jgi:hypothetical protein